MIDGLVEIGAVEVEMPTLERAKRKTQRNQWKKVKNF
jgi:hypothetical protein